MQCCMQRICGRAAATATSRPGLRCRLLLQIRVGYNSVASNALCGTIAQGTTGGVYTITCNGNVGLEGRFISVQVRGRLSEAHTATW